MEPISLSKLMKVLILLNNNKEKMYDQLDVEFNNNLERKKSVIKQLSNMSLIIENSGEIKLNDAGRKTIDLFTKELWSELSNQLCHNCQEYEVLLNVLEKKTFGEKGLLLSQIIKSSKNDHKSLNQVTAEICIDWGRRLGIIQKNLYTSGAVSRYYLIKEKYDENSVLNEIIKEYNNLSHHNSIYHLYVSIPKLRENVCEYENIKRRVFDDILKKMWIQNVNYIELASGPLTSSSRKTPTQRLSIHVDRSHAVIAPKYELTTEMGLYVGGKRYQTIAIHERS